MADMRKAGKTLRVILNILFLIVVVAAIIIGWGKEVDNPDAWFPEWVDEEVTDQPAAQPSQTNESSQK